MILLTVTSYFWLLDLSAAFDMSTITHYLLPLIFHLGSAFMTVVN